MEPGLETPAEGIQTTVDLQIIHEDRPFLDLAELLGLPATHIVQDNHFWTYRNLPKYPHTYLDSLEFFLDTLEKHFALLKVQGIQRKDISIRLSYFYEENCHLEFPPTILERMGRLGIGLELSCQRAAQTVARCLE